MPVQRALVALLLGALVLVAAPATAAPTNSPERDGERMPTLDSRWAPKVRCYGRPQLDSTCWMREFVQVTTSCDNFAGCFYAGHRAWRRRNLSGGTYSGGQYRCVLEIALLFGGWWTGGTGYVAYKVVAGATGTYLTVKTCIDAG